MQTRFTIHTQKVLKLVMAIGIGFVMLCDHPQLFAATPDAASGVVLDSASEWRMYHTLKPPVFQQADGSTKPLLMNVKWLDWETPVPSNEWTKTEMDDRAWMRGRPRRSAMAPYLARLCMRGKFEVTNPSAVSGLTLALEYHGGVVVYVNGKEIGRGNLPAGKDAGSPLAEAYPKEAFLDAQGKPIAQADAAVLSMRDRKLSLPIPKDLLRKGVNVVAIEIVRAPYLASLEGLKPRATSEKGESALLWNTCEIRTVKLSANSLDGMIANATRPKGLQVWNSDTLAGDVDADYGDRTEALNPIAISGPRNGALYGKMVMGNDQPIKSLKVVASDLKAGALTIPASQVSFLYGTPGGDESVYANGDRDRTLPPYAWGVKCLNALITEPLSDFPVGNQGNGAVVPLWVRVKVPKDAQAGLYKGTVTITTAAGAPVNASVELKVLPWTLPDTQDFKTWVDLIQSPDTLAVEYNVPLWSDKHFDLIGRSFKLISGSGARSLYIPAIAHSNLGNEESMIRWIKKSDGAYDWDFSVLDRYLDTAQKNMGTPKLVVLQVWEVYMNTKGESTGRRFGEMLDENQKNTGGAPMVTFLNADGKTENGLIPKLSDPASRGIWKALLTKFRERLRSRGYEKALVLGIFSDSTPNKADTQLFFDIAPDLTWVQQGHNIFKDLNKISKTGYTADWWSQRFADDLTQIRSDYNGSREKDGSKAMTSLFGWNNPRLDAYFPRMTYETFPMSYWHLLCEAAITSDVDRGIGRVGADMWPAVKNAKKQAIWVDERYAETRGYLHPCHSYVLEPGAEGPVAMTRLVALEEGVHECEARIYIENAMINKKLAEIAPELAKRCKEALDERLLYMWAGLGDRRFDGWGVTAWRFQQGVAGHAWLLNSEYQKRTEKLYVLAGEVEKVTGGK